MIIIDYFSPGLSHSDANAAMIKKVLNETNEDIHLFCSLGHYNVLKEFWKNANIPNERIKHHEIQVFPKKLEFARFTTDFNYIKTIFDFAKENKETKILSLYTTTVYLYFLKIFSFLNPKIQVITIIHSELERLYIAKYISGIEAKYKLAVFLYIFIFGLFIPLSINIRNLKILVYGDSIKNNLLKKIPLINEKSVISIEHPYIMTSTEETCIGNKKLTFGIIGLIELKKNGILLHKLLTDLSKKDISNLQIMLIGHFMTLKTYKKFEEFQKYDFIKFSGKNTEFITKEYRDELAKQADYFIYTYPSNSYKMTASGAFLDAIFYEKPVIAIKNDYFNHFFNKYGNIGYLCENYEELLGKINDIILKIPEEEYEMQKQNMKKIKEIINADNTNQLKLFN